MTFQIPNSQLEIAEVAQQIPTLLQNYAVQHANWRKLTMTASPVSEPVFEPRYGTVKWSIQLQNQSRIYCHTLTVFGSLDAQQKINFFTLNGVRHDELTRIYPDLSTLTEILNKADPIFEVASGY